MENFNKFVKIVIRFYFCYKYDVTFSEYFSTLLNLGRHYEFGRHYENFGQNYDLKIVNFYC
jgi:hypothetical protein